MQGFWPTSVEQRYNLEKNEAREVQMANIMRAFALTNFHADERDYVVVIFSRAGALVFWGDDYDVAEVKNTLASVHCASAAELAVRPQTLRIRRVVTAGRWAKVGASTCLGGTEFEPADRVVAVGDSVKCSER